MSAPAQSSQVWSTISEWWQEIGPGDKTAPERLLIVNVIYRAIADYVIPSTQTHDRRTARQWLFDDDDPRKPFTLSWCINNMLFPEPEHVINSIRAFCSSGATEQRNPKRLCRQSSAPRDAKLRQLQIAKGAVYKTAPKRRAHRRLGATDQPASHPWKKRWIA